MEKSIKEPMKRADLKTGDILLCPPVPFDQENPLTILGHIIIRITEGEVSHAAIYCGEIEGKQMVAHADLPGIALVSLTDFLNSEPCCYVLRHIGSGNYNKYTKDTQVIANIAIDYATEDNPYPVLNLGLLGVLLLTNKLFAKEWMVSKQFYYFLLLISLKIMKDVQNKIHPGTTPMTCSQFVAQCYTDAGVDFDISFSKMFIKYGSFNKTKIESSGTQSLLSILFEDDNLLLQSEEISLDEEYLLANEEQIIINFATLLNDKGATNHSMLSTSVDIADIKKGGRYLLKVLAEVFPDFIKVLQNGFSTDSDWSTNRNYFVAPDDLYSNTNNLISIGKLSRNDD